MIAGLHPHADVRTMVGPAEISLLLTYMLDPFLHPGLRVLGSIENIFVHEVLSDKRWLFVVARQLFVYEQQIYVVPVDTISGNNG